MHQFYKFRRSEVTMIIHTAIVWSWAISAQFQRLQWLLIKISLVHREGEITENYSQNQLVGKYRLVKYLYVIRKSWLVPTRPGSVSQSDTWFTLGASWDSSVFSFDERHTYVICKYQRMRNRYWSYILALKLCPWWFSIWVDLAGTNHTQVARGFSAISGWKDDVRLKI